MATTASNRIPVKTVAWLRRRPHTSWWAEKGPVLQFAVRFCLLLAAFYLASLLPLWNGAFSAYLHMTAWLARVGVHAVGENLQVADASIWSPHYSVTVSSACSAVEFAWFQAAAILGLPASLSKKLTGLAVGMISIGVLNVLRVASPYLAGAHGLAGLSAIHEDVWPILMIVATVASLANWMGWALAAPLSEANAAC
jgi:exosortase/archaeosortase family protein